MAPPHSDRDLLAWSVRFEAKFDNFMEAHGKVHESMIVESTRNSLLIDELKRDMDKREKEASALFSKVRQVERKIIYFTGAGSVLLFLATKVLDKFVK
jgi:hypothetical protein